MPLSPPVPASRECALVPGECAFLVIDMQNYCVHPRGSEWTVEGGVPTEYFLSRLPSVLGNTQALLASARARGIECLFTTIESLTLDGRDRSLDYKLSGFNVPRGSWDAKVAGCIAPGPDEIVLPKCSSSVFCSTVAAYKLRNLGVKQVVLLGGLTDQCVDSAVRDACDGGFLVTVVTDGCITHSAERHDSALRNNKGYARQRTTLELLSELRDVAPRPGEAAAQPIAAPPPVALPQPWGDGAEWDGGAPPAAAARVPAAAGPDPAAAAVTGAGRPREYVRFEIIDFNGKALNKTVPQRHAHRPVLLYSGAISLGANSEVLEIPPELMAVGCPNTRLVPIPRTEQLLPWASAVPDGGPACGVRVHRVYCEQEGADGEPNLAVPRHACRAQLAALAAHGGRGLELYSASELEFCLATGDAARGPAFLGPEIFVTLQQTKAAGYCYAVEEAMAAVGVDILTMNPEYGDGQLELTFAPKRGVAAADAASTFRTGCKEIAQQRGLLATFMSKPFSLDGPGNGGHFNFSLWEPAGGPSAPSEDEASLDGLASALGAAASGAAAAGEGGAALTPTAQHFLAGVLAHARGLEAFCSPTPACYLRHGHWAPDLANWGFDDRTAAVRVKLGSAVDGFRGTYLEWRMPSSSACAYLLIAALVAAGLDGLERESPLPPPRQTAASGATRLPTSLPEALDALEADAVLVSRLGEPLVKWFVGLKRAELAAVDARIAASCKRGKVSEKEARMEAWRHFYLEFL